MTPAELDDLERKAKAVAPTGHTAFCSCKACWGADNAKFDLITAVVKNLPALIAVAKEHARLVSALEFLRAYPDSLKITLPAPFDDYTATAESLGWRFPEGDPTDGR